MGVAKSWVVGSTRRPTTQHARKHRYIPSVEALEAREVPTLNPSGYEQQMLELLNTMRMAPQGELGRLLVSTNPLQARDPQVQAALDYFGVSGSTLASQWSTLKAAAPLAWSEALMASSLGHNQAMIAADQQSHQLPGEASLGTRITSAGYAGWTAVGENIYAYATSVGYGHAGFAIDWGTGPGGIQSPAGHRINMMNPNYREIGISITNESNPNTQVGPFVITQDLGTRSNFGNPFLLGVAYSDTNKNNRYDAGEGLGGVKISVTGAGTYTATTMTAGGYQLKVPAGSYTVTFSGGGLASPIIKSVTVGSANVKVDGIAGQSSGGGGGGGSAGSANHAPVLNTAGLFSLGAAVEDVKVSLAKTIATLLGTNVTDADANALKGIAITTVDTNQGTWQYTKNGTTWTAVSGVTESAALLLRSTDSLRFVPKANFNGDAAFTFRAWDRTTGTVGTKANLTAGVGGSTAYSAQSALAKLLVTPANDAPILSTAKPFALYTLTNGGANPGTLVGTLLGSAIKDVDAGALQGIAVTALGGTTYGTWQFSTNGGQSWTTFGTTSTSVTRLLRPSDLIRFVPKAGYKGSVSLQFRAWDQTTGVAGGTMSLKTSTGALRVGGANAFSTAYALASLKVI